MSYYVLGRGSEFHIDSSVKQDAAAALIAYDNAARAENPYRDSISDCKNLEEILRVWGWDTTDDNDGNIDGICLVEEQLGDEEEWFEIIAPFVKEGSYIALEGEDGYIWCYYFDGSHYTTHKGEITFPTIRHSNAVRQRIRISC